MIYSVALVLTAQQSDSLSLSLSHTHTHTHTHSFSDFSLIGYYKILSIVPYAIEQVPVGDLFYICIIFLMSMKSAVMPSVSFLIL